MRNNRVQNGETKSVNEGKAESRADITGDAISHSQPKLSQRMPASQDGVCVEVVLYNINESAANDKKPWAKPLGM
jgi:hypothetical protein